MASTKTRALVACTALVGCFTVFSFRLVHLQVTKHAEYREMAADKHVIKRTLYGRRGAILDVNGEVLAQNELIKTVFADGLIIKDPAPIAAILAPKLGMTVTEVIQKLETKRLLKDENKRVPSRYIVVKRKVPEAVALEIAAQLSEKKLRGINFEQDFERVYPNGQMLCHVLGYVNNENEGVDGIEKTFERELGAIQGYRYIERDRMGRELVPYRGEDRPAKNGADVRLTIDMGLQAIIEDELDAVVKQWRPRSASVVLMRPQTGEILAMANRPHYNLNLRGEKTLPDENRRNRAITDMVEPGSTFKIVPVGAALAQRLVRPEHPIFCENGRFKYGGRYLRDAHPHGSLSVSDILVKSSNIGAAKLAIQLGEQKLYEYVRRFGFGERTNVSLPGESQGQVNLPHTWDKLSITRIPMGHAVCVTPLQLVTAMSVIANGGVLMTPQIVREVVDAKGNVTPFPPVEVRRVLPVETTRVVRDALVEVVSKRGTAQRAHIPGFKVAGKTGTAQRVAEKGGYESGKYVVSFAGFMPAEAPEFAAVVLIDDARAAKPGESYGGIIAAPVFARIGERAARYLNLVPTPEIPPGSVVVTQANPATPRAPR